MAFQGPCILTVRLHPAGRLQTSSVGGGLYHPAPRSLRVSSLGLGSRWRACARGAQGIQGIKQRRSVLACL
eukprot:1650072-Pyramimonas_sp.AAC.1